VDPDKAFAVQVAHEEGVLTTSAAYMQCALLYTSSNGERRIRRARASPLRGAPAQRAREAACISPLPPTPPVPALYCIAQGPGALDCGGAVRLARRPLGVSGGF